MKLALQKKASESREQEAELLALIVSNSELEEISAPKKQKGKAQSVMSKAWKALRAKLSPKDEASIQCQEA